MSLVALIVAAFTLAAITRWFLLEAFTVRSHSMAPTLLTGDRVLVSKLSYRLTRPRRGHVVVFDPARDARAFMRTELVWARLRSLPWRLGQRRSSRCSVKRVAGLEGESLRAYTGGIYVNGVRLGPNDRVDTASETEGHTYLVPHSSVFLLGDNLAVSRDSRSLGPIPEACIVGRAFAVIWPLKRVRLLQATGGDRTGRNRRLPIVEEAEVGRQRQLREGRG